MKGYPSLGRIKACVTVKGKQIVIETHAFVYKYRINTTLLLWNPMRITAYIPPECEPIRGFWSNTACDLYKAVFCRLMEPHDAINGTFVYKPFHKYIILL